MKKFKKTLALVMAVITVISMFCCLTVSAGAATKTIKNDTYVNVTAEETYYKVTVTGEGYIAVSAVATKNKKVDYSSASADIEVLNSKKKDFCKTDDDLYVSTSSGYEKDSVVIPVSKGTYYLYVDSLYRYNSATIKLKYKFTSVKQPTNYCVGKAVTVAAGKTQKIYQTPSQNFDRWYKITLKKNQKITITSTGYRGFYIYDAEGNKFNTEYNYDYDTGIYTETSSAKIAKGTYYLYLPVCSSHAPNTAAYATFSWK